MDDLKTEIEDIKKRNKRVETAKAWETSGTRIFSIAVLTYIVIVLFFIMAKLPKPFINPIVPTVGFVLSTFSLPFIKRYWIKKRS